MKKTAVLLLTGLALLSSLTLAQAANLGTSLTYQGSLNGAAGPVSGLYDFTFQIYAYPAGGVNACMLHSRKESPAGQII